ncbi:unnamed protein product [Arctogadus glacialis]
MDRGRKIPPSYKRYLSDESQDIPRTTELYRKLLKSAKTEPTSSSDSEDELHGLPPASASEISEQELVVQCQIDDISDSSEDVSAGSGPERGIQMEVGNMDEHGGNTCDSELLQHMNAQQEEYDGAEQYIAGDGHEHGCLAFVRRSCLMKSTLTPTTLSLKELMFQRDNC